MLNRFQNHPPGVSLLIAIIFVSALMLVVANLAETTYRSYHNIQNYNNFSKAETAAKTLVAQAKLLAERHEPGWNSSASWTLGSALPAEKDRERRERNRK